MRAEILTFFCSYFGRNDDFINSFWNLLTFRESSHVQLRMSLSTVAMGTLLEFQYILVPKSDVFLKSMTTYLVWECQHYKCYVNTKGTKVLGTHYSLPNIHFRVLSLMLKIVCPNIVKGFKGNHKMEKSARVRFFLIECKY